MIPVPPKHPHPDAFPVVFAKNQAEYDPLPAFVDRNGMVMTEWELTAEDLAKVLAGGRVRLWVWTFGRGFSPVALEVIE
jgi:hypothetical protein